MNRVEAIQMIINRYKGAFFILSNGLTSREAAFKCHQSGSLYLLHAMGEALSVGFGIASAINNIDIIVIDGDGNSLMGSSSWVMNQYPNLKYFVLSNGVYDTTGGQDLPENINWPEWCEVIGTDNQPSDPSPNPPTPSDILKEVSFWLKEHIS